MTRPAGDEDDAGEAALDDTLAATFPASDPLSTDPNPGHAEEHVRNSEDEEPSAAEPRQEHEPGGKTS